MTKMKKLYVAAAVSAMLAETQTGAQEPQESSQMFQKPEIKFVRGGRYNWKGQPDRLIYLGKVGSWNQFKKIGDPREVWCEVLDGDLHHLEETKEPTV